MPSTSPCAPDVETMEIRRATASDANSILDLWEVAGAAISKTDNPAHVARAIHHPSAVFLLAVAEGQIVGSLLGGFDGWRGNMYRLAVHPKYRRKGIARSLVHRVEQEFVQWGVTRVTALVERDRRSAVQFWEAVGYLQDEHFVRHVGTLESKRS